MQTTQAHPLHLLPNPLDPPRHGPDFLYEAHDPLATQARRGLGQPVPRPDEHVMRQFHEQDDDGLGHQPPLANHRSGQPMLVALQISLDARSLVIGRDDRLHAPLGATGEGHGRHVTACLLGRRRTHRLL